MSLAESRISGDAHDNGRSFEPLLQEFDDAWANADTPPAINQFVVTANLPSSVEPLEFIEELIKIDLEYRWRRRKTPTAVAWTLDDYAERLHLTEPFPSNELIGEEYWVRQLWGDCPSRAEFFNRYAPRGDALRRKLSALDTELAQQAAGLGNDESRRHVSGETPRSLPAFDTSPHSGSVGPAPVVPGYKILDVLDHGGMAVVYRARQLSLNRIVALKVIRSGEHASPKELDRFRAEIEAVASLRHRHIVQVFEAGQWNGMPYCAMELVSGGSLAQKLNGIPLQADSAARLTIKLARALDAAHQAGIVHRDLKPANVLLEPMRHGDGFERHTESGGLQHFEPKVADFGLAKRLGDSTLHTATGELLGTPSYMAPEQAAGNQEDIGPRTDVYALGVMLYEMLTGHPPFRATTSLETVRQVIRDDPVSLRRLQPDVPRDLETICCKCLEKNPAKRYLSAAELASDIDRFLAGHPILARRSGPVERATKWSRRNPAWAVAITIGALAAVGIVAGTALHNRQLQAEIKRTNESAAEAQRQKSQALANFNKTHETLLGILTRLWQESQLSDDAINRDLRESLLQTMLRYYNEVPLDQADSDPDVRLTKALVDFNAAHVHHYLEEYDIAEEQFRRALPTLEELATAHPNNAGYRRWWALCCFRLGVTLNLSSDTKQAAEWLRQALVVLEPAPKDDLNIRTLKARCHMELAQLYRPNDLAAAELQAVHGVALWKSILSEEPGNDEYRWNLCTALNTLAQLVVGDGNLQKGEALVVESASAASKWSGAANSYYVLGSRTDMADSYRFLGFGAAEQQQDDAALAYLATAGRLLDDVFKVNPRFSEARGIANGVYWIRAMLHQKMGMQDKALGDWDRAVEFGDGGLRDIAWIQRAKYRLDLGDYKKAASEADELLASRELAREHLFELARVYCDCATAADLSESLNSDEQAREKDELAARAVQCLARCQAADFFSDAKHRQMLQTASFEVLRGRPDFQKPLDEMAGVADER